MMVAESCLPDRVPFSTQYQLSETFVTECGILQSNAHRVEHTKLPYWS